MKKLIRGAESYVLESETVSVAVTETGGHHIARFRLGEREVSPYALAPWEPAEYEEELPVLLSHLRGDFMCLPFGGKENGPPHGETANATWQEAGSSAQALVLSQSASDTGASVRKKIALREGETALYLEHEITGLTGAWSYGSHPVLDLSGLEEGQGRVSVSPFRWASVNRGLFSDPVNREYQALKPGATFSELSAVPAMDGGTVDLTRYPARRGFEDLVLMANEPGEAPFAWTACVFDGYVWFCLKNPRDFPSTMFWMSNGGRHGAPWNGRHLGRLGLEEVCSYFANGVADSRQNPLAEEGVPTVRDFDGTPVSLRLIQAVAAVPADFDLVTDIRPAGQGKITLSSESGASVETAIDWGFVG
ncbi:MAG: hypothetical protein ACQKBY_07300 [Verrucomicrobiales bacterium]